jgi:hypothetical protein
MLNQLWNLREVINLGFDLLDLIVIRRALLGLAAVGAYSLLKKH